MKVILRSNDAGDSFQIYKAKEGQNLTDLMRYLWEDCYNDNLVNDVELTEEDTWFEEDQAQIVSNGWYIAEFKIIEVEEVDIK